MSLRYEDDFVERLVEEIELRGRNHDGEPINTLYLGGGTPSMLSRKNLTKIQESLHRHFPFRQDAEMTIECNPEDLDPPFLDFLITAGFNRLSIGIQSFHAKDLLFISFRASKPSISLTVTVLPFPLGGVFGNEKLYTPRSIEARAASHIG